MVDQGDALRSLVPQGLRFLRRKRRLDRTVTAGGNSRWIKRNLREISMA